MQVWNFYILINETKHKYEIPIILSFVADVDNPAHGDGRR